ncbi:hypothetical protein [Roseibium limicola]|uniref:Uncharacterized protein n=1 Tax=Roseibium limicola TaxID=2816037 RepID=A0A939EJQ6_9HYPH|nr:hypothetical protein [Roseibium limicola]MBO0343886.1 hypothetical protein [Roseibium limicola]
MAAVGNYRSREERTSLKDFNENWSARRRQAIDNGKALRQNAVQGVFGTNMFAVQRQVVNSIQNGAGAYSSNASAMARINLLV